METASAVQMPPAVPASQKCELQNLKCCNPQVISKVFGFGARFLAETLVKYVAMGKRKC